MFPFSLPESLEIVHIRPFLAPPWSRPDLHGLLEEMLGWPLGRAFWLQRPPSALMGLPAPDYQHVPFVVLPLGPGIKSEGPVLGCNPPLPRLCYRDPVWIPRTLYQRSSSVVSKPVPSSMFCSFCIQGLEWFSFLLMLPEKVRKIGVGISVSLKKKTL